MTTLATLTALRDADGRALRRAFIALTALTLLLTVPFLLPEGLGEGKAPAQAPGKAPAQFLHRRTAVAFQGSQCPEDGQAALEQQPQPPEESLPFQVRQGPFLLQNGFHGITSFPRFLSGRKEQIPSQVEKEGHYWAFYRHEWKKGGVKKLSHPPSTVS